MNAVNMAKSKHKDDITIREIEYSFLVKGKENGFREVIDILRSELTRFEDLRRKTVYNENPIREFLKTNIERSIVIHDNTRVCLTNYQENGVYAIQFTLLIISAHVHYDTTRQVLDDLIKATIADYFEELLVRHLPLSVTVQSAENKLFEIPGTQGTNESKHRPLRNLLPIVLASVALILSLSFGLLWFLQKKQSNTILKPSAEYRDKYFEILIDKKINEAFNNEKLNFILYKNSVTASDSGMNITYKQKK